jgi:hypothetical protein
MEGKCKKADNFERREDTGEVDVNWINSAKREKVKA